MGNDQNRAQDVRRKLLVGKKEPVEKKQERAIFFSDDSREHSVGDALLVLDPDFLVLGRALVVVADGAMSIERDEVDGVPEGEEVREAAGEGKREGDDPVSQVVGLAEDTPPSGDEDATVTERFRLLAPDEHVGIVLKVILLGVGASEDPVADAEEEDESDLPERSDASGDGLRGHEVPGLDGEGEPHPPKVSKD